MAVKRGVGTYQIQRTTRLPAWQPLATLPTPNYFVARDEWEQGNPIAYNYPIRGIMFNAISTAEPTRDFYGSDEVRALTGDEVAQVIGGRDPWREMRKRS